MGLFGKKKAMTGATGAPNAGQYVAPAPVATPPRAPVSAAVPPSSHSSPMQNPSVSTNLQANTAPQNLRPDIEMAAKTPNTIPPPSTNRESDSLSAILAVPAHDTPAAILAVPPHDPDAEEMFTVDGTKTTKTEYTYPTKTDYTYPTLKTANSEDTHDTAFTITRNGQYLTLNGFANGHLMRWKFAAEEGPPLIRIPAVLLALGVIFTSTYPLVMNSSYWTVPIAICCFHTVVFASLIVVLEGRVFCGVRGPTHIRARIRSAVTRYINMFRVVWGRGLLYIFVGTMNLTIDHKNVVYTGLPLAALGIASIFTGAHATYNLDKMKASLTDTAYLWNRFDACDHDKDNLLNLDGFAELLWQLGLEFDDAYTYKAFSQIDTDKDGLVSFEDFKNWWIVVQRSGR